MEIIFNEALQAGTATIKLGQQNLDLAIVTGKQLGHRMNVEIPPGKITLSVDATLGERTFGPHQVILTRKESNSMRSLCVSSTDKARVTTIQISQPLFFQSGPQGVDQS